MLRDLPIRRKIIAMLLLTSGTVLVITCLAFIAYEFIAFRQGMVRNVSTLGQVIAANSTAALAFDNQDDAREILAALRAEDHVAAAALYDRRGKLFASYPASVPPAAFPAAPEPDGYRFENNHLIVVEPIKQGNNKRLGALYLKVDERALYAQLRLNSLIAVAMMALVLAAAYLLSRVLQRQISTPVLKLAQTAAAVSSGHDYSVRAQKYGNDEIGLLTDAFNQMLGQIQAQDRGVRESESRLRAVLQSALSGVIMMDGEGKIIGWNPRAQQMFGWAREEVLGYELATTIIPAALQSQHRRGLERFLRTGEGPVLNRLIEIDAKRRDGSEFPVELSISILESSGRVEFCGFVTDISERKHARDKLQAQLHRLDLLHQITHAIGERLDLRSIFQIVTRSLEDRLPLDFGCICLYDPIGNALTVSGIGTRSSVLALQMNMADQTRIDIGDGLSQCIGGHLVYEPDIGAEAAPFMRRLAAAGLRSLVIAPLLAENKVFGVVIAARYASDGFSSTDCEFLSQLSDHTALAARQAQLYGDLQRAYDELRQSQQATLQQERLRALGQMASGVAHDINNAISPIALYTESLLEREPGLSERTRTYLQTIQRAIDDVALTVSRMREFYRPRELQLALSQIGLNEIVQQVIELTRARWRDVPQERGVVIELRTEFAALLPKIMGAENEIRDALTNLIFNAIDAMPEGGTITLRTRSIMQLESDTRQVALEVTDTGVGMDEETQRRCLEPFYTTKGERGTGMGLAMVYGMAQRHSAELQIDSAVGKGTTVRLIFAVAGSVPAARGTRVAMKLPIKPMRLLIIDDDPLITESLREVLRREGHDVTTADGGQAGIEEFAAAHTNGSAYDIVITDLGMPYVNGGHVAAAIKVTSPQTPVILLTGWGQRLLDERELPAGVDRVLSKPPKLEELRLALVELSVT